MLRAPRVVLAAVVAILALLAVPLTSSAAAPEKARVEVGKVRLANAPGGRPALLVPVSYPIEMAGRRVQLSVLLRDPSGALVRRWTVRPLANAGPLRFPERRKRFSFVHRVDVDAAVADELRSGSTVRVLALARLDADRDGESELRALDRSAQAAPLAIADGRLCATPPKRRARPGRAVVVPLPLCNKPVAWRIGVRPKQGSARIRDGKLIFRPREGFRGTVSITLAANGAGASASVTPVAALAPVQITVGAAEDPVVRAFGDSVTAGFGYYEHGELMGITSLLSCRPGEEFYDDACSSNSKVRNNKATKVEYASDYGLSNNVSWVAQWANAHGVTDFKNFAVSGSEPSNWFGKGQLAETFQQMVSEDPDYVLLTMGGNPLLSNMLFGIGNIGCGIWADLFGRFRECVEEEFTAIKLQQNLKTLYTNLVKETDAQIFVMQYHLSIPTTALYGVEQIAEMGNLLNAEIAKVAKEVSPSRITVVSPPHFDVGLSLGQAYPSKYKCEGRFFTSVVDGRSVQAAISQSMLGKLHPVEFCAGANGQAPWVISGDSGIHPSAAGYQQMAAEVPAPK